MKNPTELQMVAEFKRLFPLATLSGHERAFLAFIHLARSHGVGFGWMRQAIGIAWKMADPLGYIDDERLIDLHTKRPPRRASRGGRCRPSCGKVGGKTSEPRSHTSALQPCSRTTRPRGSGMTRRRNHDGDV